MTYTMKIQRRINHLRRFALMIRVLATLSFLVTSGFYLFVTLFQGVVVSSVGQVAYESAYTSGPSVDGAFIAMALALGLGLFIVSLLPFSFFYFMADMLIGQADYLEIQLKMLASLPKSAALDIFPSVGANEPAFRLPTDDMRYAPR